jgi:hypothetical protein
VFMIDLRMINMSSECEYDWYWKNISLLERIWSLWLVRFAHFPTSFIFWLGRLIFSVSINSHPDNIYLLRLEQQVNKHEVYWQTYIIIHVILVLHGNHPPILTSHLSVIIFII